MSRVPPAPTQAWPPLLSAPPARMTCYQGAPAMTPWPPQPIAHPKVHSSPRGHSWSPQSIAHLGFTLGRPSA